MSKRIVPLMSAEMMEEARDWESRVFEQVCVWQDSSRRLKLWRFWRRRWIGSARWRGWWWAVRRLKIKDILCTISLSFLELSLVWR